jgi:hypothetical protein
MRGGKLVQISNFLPNVQWQILRGATGGKMVKKLLNLQDSPEQEINNLKNFSSVGKEISKFEDKARREKNRRVVLLVQ